MPGQTKTQNREVVTKPSDGTIAGHIAKLLASQPPTVDDLVSDPMVRMRIGTLITRAVERQAKPPCRVKTR
jgi:hypothetical protein